MKKLLFLFALTAMTLSVFGQDNQNRPERGGNFAERRTAMYKELGLTAEQTEKVKKLDETRDADIKKLREESSTDRDAQRKKMTEIQKKWNDDFEKVLTPDQQKKWKEIQEKNAKEREKRGGDRSQRGGGDRPAPQN